MSDAARVRAIEGADVDALVALNNLHVAEIGETSAAAFAELVAIAARATAIGEVGAPEAFLIALDDRLPAHGPNHAWFLARHPRFLYVDRVCVAEASRGRGLARALYADAFAAARAAGAPVVCCEVNLEPPNPGSDAFHAALGFAEVGRARLVERHKLVRYLERAP
ncbi:MAG TPA: GNAT family N-acetyltransferase [Byssovorax sp.]